jgi:hypothetical protein
MPMRLTDGYAGSVLATITRRSALLALGGAAAGTNVTGRSGLAARNTAGKKAARVRRRFKQRCRKQKALCRAELAVEPALAACCESCFADEFMACFFQFFI